ncbi:MAG: DUF2813 domain-containing protein [Bacteroidetes bacterium]|nr:MAG: DUF2813 domain-containing protein [Bacteroidota bacterium]
MITYIKINGFKSFHHFEMEFAPFTVIAGANASGKSNLFDALMLLASLAETDHLKKAFKKQRGELLELFAQYNKNEYATEMEFCVEMLVNPKVKDAWGNEAILKYTRLRYELKIKRFTNNSGLEDLAVIYEHLENLKHSDDKWIEKIDKKQIEKFRPKIPTGGRRAIPYIQTKIENGIDTVLVPQDGTTGNKRRFPLNNATRTVLSSFDTVDFPHVLAAKKEMIDWKFLQLNPEDLRESSRQDADDLISPSGKNLAAALFRLKQNDNYNLVEISRKLQTFLPNFTEVNVIDDKENRQFLIKLKDKEKKEYTSRVLSEGTLRILALCILEFDDKYTGLLCFEEPENGIHPIKISEMSVLLKGLSSNFSEDQMSLRQIIVNTHSPVLVGNILERYLNDKNVKTYFSHMSSMIATVSDQKISINATQIVELFEGHDPKTEIGNISAQRDHELKRKYALSNIKKYLETSNFTDLTEKLKQN